jgi:hypothetical protein
VSPTFAQRRSHRVRKPAAAGPKACGDVIMPSREDAANQGASRRERFSPIASPSAAHCNDGLKLRAIPSWWRWSINCAGVVRKAVSARCERFQRNLHCEAS